MKSCLPKEIGGSRATLPIYAESGSVLCAFLQQGKYAQRQKNDYNHQDCLHGSHRGCRAPPPDGLCYISSHNGLYLLQQGTSRVGFVVAVLESLMSASAQEVVDNYMVSFSSRPAQSSTRRLPIALSSIHCIPPISFSICMTQM